RTRSMRASATVAAQLPRVSRSRGLSWVTKRVPRSMPVFFFHGSICGESSSPRGRLLARRLLHRGPQARRMELLDISLDLIALAGGDHGLTLGVNPHHQLCRLLAGVTEHGFEDVGHVLIRLTGSS